MVEPSGPEPARAPGPWHRQSERGSSSGLRITAWLYRLVGRPICSLLVYPIVGYFFVTDARGRGFALDYLERLHRFAPRALPRVPGLGDAFRVYLEFGQAILDRVGFWLGRSDDFEFTIEGMEHLDAIAQAGRGGVILGAHLGSFDAMRLMARERSPISVNLLVYRQHAERINALFDRLDPDGDARGGVRAIPIVPGSPSHVFAAQAAVGRGEVIALLADRLDPSEAHRASRVEFLGDAVTLPNGPFLLASALGCPVLSMFALRSPGSRYTIHVEPFAEQIELPRRARSAALARYAQAFADRLADYCARAPYQWFNFYDYWAPARSEPTAGALPEAAEERAKPEAPRALS